MRMQVVDKVKMQMDSFLEDGSHEATVAVIRALSMAIPLTTSTLRDYILFQLYFRSHDVLLDCFVSNEPCLDSNNRVLLS